MPDNHGGAVLVVVPPRVADGKPPAPACEKGFVRDFFYAAGERADGVAAAAVDVVGGGGAQHGGMLGGVFQNVGVVVLLGEVVVVPRGVFDAAVQLVVPFLDELDERRGVVLQLGDGFGQPCGVNDTQVGALQHEGLLGEKLHKGFFAVFRLPLPRGVVAAVFAGAAVKKPARAVFGFVGEQVDFVVAQHHEGVARADGLFCPVGYGGGIGAAVNQIAHKDEFASLRVFAGGRVAQIVQQVLQGFKLPVYVADDVQRTTGKGLDKGHNVALG